MNIDKTYFSNYWKSGIEENMLVLVLERDASDIDFEDFMKKLLKCPLNNPETLAPCYKNIY